MPSKLCTPGAVYSNGSELYVVREGLRWYGGRISFRETTFTVTQGHGGYGQLEMQAILMGPLLSREFLDEEEFERAIRLMLSDGIENEDLMRRIYHNMEARNA